MNPKQLARKVLPHAGIHLAEESYRKGRIYALQARYGFPARGLRVIAVTGTNGKTTTCLYINEMLKKAGYKTALFTTAVVEVNGKRQLNTTHRTVPLSSQLVSFLRKAKAGKIDFLVLEVTSQALDQHKIIGIPIEVAVMTNLSQDHLDYHKTMQAYAAAKARLFNGYMRPKRVVLNADDEWFGYFRDQAVGEVMTYGQDEAATIRMNNMRVRANGSEWTITESGADASLATSIPGEFNIYNATAAACVGKLLGLNTDQLRSGIAALQAVPGRMQTVDAGQPFTVLVDYAHTPDALANVLAAARQIAGRDKVSVVFGATGDRDKSKRSKMGQVVARAADRIYLTDDETYTEDPVVIRTVVAEGIMAEHKKYTEIPDRELAIATALKAAQPGDVVVLAGIGHQDTRNMGGRLVRWDEAAIACKVIDSL